MINFLLTILEYMIWWLPILMLLTPVVWTIIYYSWYVDYKEKKEVECWERINRFFAKNADKYPEAATSFGMARFWHSQSGHSMMRKIKEAKFYEQA